MNVFHREMIIWFLSVIFSLRLDSQILIYCLWYMLKEYQHGKYDRALMNHLPIIIDKLLFIFILHMQAFGHGKES